MRFYTTKAQTGHLSCYKSALAGLGTRIALGQILTQSRHLISSRHPRNLTQTDSKAVTPISPAAQKFQVLIRWSRLDSSVALSCSLVPGLMPGKWHNADANQNAAEPQPVISAAVSIYDFMTFPINSARIARRASTQPRADIAGSFKVASN